MKRVCAVCQTKDNPSEIFEFEQLLRELEIGGRHAHAYCVMHEQQKLRDYIRKHGKCQ